MEVSPSQSPDDVIGIVDVPMKFRISKGLDGEPVVVTVDALILKLLCERLERKHNLQVEDEHYVTTPEFLTDLAQTFSPYIPECTPTAAYQIWTAVTEQMAVLKKNIEEQLKSPSGTE